MRTQRGFSLLEVLIALGIGVIVILATFYIFSRSNQTSIGQDEVAGMDSTLANVSAIVRTHITNAGFGLTVAHADLAIRTFENVANQTPDNLGFQPGGPTNLRVANSFFLPTAKAMQFSDAVLTTQGVVACEAVTVNPSSPPLASGFSNTYTLDVCQTAPPPAPSLCSVPDLATARLALTGTAVPTGTGDDRVLVLVGQNLTSITLKVNPNSFSTLSGAGICGGGTYYEFTANAVGLQLTKDWTPLAGATPYSAHVVTGNFFYLGQDRNLYDIPLGFIPNTQSALASRVLANDVESFQLHYMMAGDTLRDKIVPGGIDPGGPGYKVTAGNSTFNGIQNTNGDQIEDTHDIRNIEFAILVRASRKDEGNFLNQGKIFALMNENIGGALNDSYRRRVIRESVLVRNLHAFNYFAPPTNAY